MTSAPSIAVGLVPLVALVALPQVLASKVFPHEAVPGDRHPPTGAAISSGWSLPTASTPYSTFPVKVLFWTRLASLGSAVPETGAPA
jgi:hypothetical protein